MSNVKAGDLCYIVGSPVKEVNGHVATAVRRFLLGGEPYWELSPSINNFWWAGAEKRLRPIRPQPDDAQDESFRWAPAPEKVAA